MNVLRRVGGGGNNNNASNTSGGAGAAAASGAGQQQSINNNNGSTDGNGTNAGLDACGQPLDRHFGLENVSICFGEMYCGQQLTLHT
jgi:hypothetical protein